MMKKVILLGLLSLSMCLSNPTEEKVAPTPNAAPNAAVTNVSPVDQKEKTLNASTPHVETQTVNKTATESKPTSTQISSDQPKTSEPTPQPKENTTKPVDNKTTEKEVPPNGKDEKEVPKNSTETKAATEKATDKPKNETTGKIDTTIKPDMSKPTEAPKSEDKHVLQARGFDGPSFIGGMILTLGLLAIGFMGFKYYKNQTERNYHTL